jgi:hypothetical protein
MSKELPFFKFNATEWITGNISYESFELQGAFISVCAEYWNRNNDLSIDEAKLRLRNATIVEILIEKNYLKTKKNKIVISFLDKEQKEIESKRLKLSESGRKGGLSKAKASLKQCSSIKEVDKEEEKDNKKNPVTFDSRKKSFAHSLAFYLETYGKEMIREFYDYWTEHGEQDKKMRFEKQSSFNLELRLKRWNKNVQERNKPKVNLPTEIWEG